jgi:hypothetical protein
LLPPSLHQDAESKVHQPLAIAATHPALIAVSYQIDHGVEVDVTAEPELVSGPDQAGEPGISNVEAVVEIHGVPAEAQSTFEIKSECLQGVKLGDEESAAEGFNRVSLVVNPREDLTAQSEMRTDSTAQSKRESGLIEQRGVPCPAEKIIGLSAGTEARPEPESVPGVFPDFDQTGRWLLSRRGAESAGERQSGKQKDEDRGVSKTVLRAERDLRGSTGEGQHTILPLTLT